MVTQKTVSVEAPRFQQAVFRIRGIAPYVQHKFGAKARLELHQTQEAGHTARKGKKKEGKDFQQMYQEAMHISSEGWFGIPAPAFRNAMISACKMVGYAMTRAKLSLFVEPDGFDKDDMTPLVRIVKGEPRYFEAYVRLQGPGNPVDLHARPMWDPGWEADVHITFDADQMSLADVGNLLTRVGLQVGIGEGRPDSKSSCGMGWGLFIVEGEKHNGTN